MKKFNVTLSPHLLAVVVLVVLGGIGSTSGCSPLETAGCVAKLGLHSFINLIRADRHRACRSIQEAIDCLKNSCGNNIPMDVVQTVMRKIRDVGCDIDLSSLPGASGSASNSGAKVVSGLPLFHCPAVWAVFLPAALALLFSSLGISAV